MSKFLCPLDVELMADDKGPIVDKDGKQLWTVKTDFYYQSDLVGLIVVPQSFITNFASVPRLPLLYASLGDLFQRSATVHDYLYSTRKFPRETCDKVLLEAMELDGIGWMKRKMVYAAVRVGGGGHY